MNIAPMHNTASHVYRCPYRNRHPSFLISMLCLEFIEPTQLPHSHYYYGCWHQHKFHAFRNSSWNTYWKCKCNPNFFFFLPIFLTGLQWVWFWRGSTGSDAYLKERGIWTWRILWVHWKFSTQLPALSLSDDIISSFCITIFLWWLQARWPWHYFYGDTIVDELVDRYTHLKKDIIDFLYCY